MNKIISVILLLVCMVSVVAAGEAFDYAARWKAWDASSRAAYVAGVTEAIPIAFFTTKGSLTKKLSPKEELQILDTLKFASPIEKKKIIEVMTDIYQNPANSYIETAKIFIFAQDKIEGKDISKALEDAREQAYDLYKLEQKMKQEK